MCMREEGHRLLSKMLMFFPDTKLEATTEAEVGLQVP